MGLSNYLVELLKSSPSMLFLGHAKLSLSYIICKLGLSLHHHLENSIRSCKSVHLFSSNSFKCSLW